MKKQNHSDVPKGGLISRLVTLYPIISLIGLYRFTASFFLAKKSMSQISQCNHDTASTLLVNEIGLSEADITYLHKFGILSTHGTQSDAGGRILRSDSNGCWMPKRVDSMAIIVVDALRFDFALQHLPKSVGGRLLYEDRNFKNMKNKDTDNNQSTLPRGQSQLFKFVADPPTVTMQRLKGLTTGGLPTFADISGSFGGANVDEDSWVQQLYDVPIFKRGMADFHKDNERVALMGFVGDDTWVDLFPHQFDDSHPYPSFNTRDLDTVDNGCLLHLPRLLKSFGSSSINAMENFYELIVVHFLGVDHVGHTYGPNNEHMDAKLNQMDDVLQNILSKVDDSEDKCQVVFVFGDHGMTEDGNHGGGSEDETNAGLFAHFSPGCGDLGPSLDISGAEIGSYSQEAFRSINQIDLVPTISLLLGLPIPFANLGGVVPGLLPPLHYHAEETIVEAPYVATALALNAAQVWNYLHTYSSTANKLPDSAIADLQELLENASSRFREALGQKDSFDSLAYREACGLFKYFLSQATDLGKQVWTRFDTTGMGAGIILLIISLILGIPFNNKISFSQASLVRALKTKRKTKLERSILGSIIIEMLVVVVAIAFHCIVLTFSNSYIISEKQIIMFLLSMLCLVTSLLQFVHMNRSVVWSSNRSNGNPLNMDGPYLYPLLIMLCSRLHQLFVSGHGQDPMIRKHWAHNSYVFVTSLIVLSVLRVLYFVTKTSTLQLSKTHTIMDVATMCFLCVSWLEKRTLEISRHGYMSSRLAMVLCTVGFVMICFQWSCTNNHPSKENRAHIYLHKTLMTVIKVLLFIVTVTGPSTATTCILITMKVYALSALTFERGAGMRSAPLLAAIWRLSIRHVFFVTEHACSFNRLHFSAAFVATETFYFFTAGISLFLNTFGWDLLGIVLVAAISRAANRLDVWKYFCFYQMMETVFSCISVTLMRRHLMVWAIFAPRFTFATIFLGLCLLYFLFDQYLIGIRAVPSGDQAENDSKRSD